MNSRPPPSTLQTQFDCVKNCFEQEQQNLIQCVNQVEGNSCFVSDHWNSALGSGISAITADNNLIEKAFIGFSCVGGNQLPKTAAERHPELIGKTWKAVGVSTVIHPQSPWIPAAHMNVRFFQAGAFADDGDGNDNTAATNWWFGGGFDLTPCYPEPEDCRLWHQAAQDAIEPFAPGHYRTFKETCDNYFYLPHRKEMRGIGGIFFDDYNSGDFDQCLNMARSVCSHFAKAWSSLARKYAKRSYSPNQKAFQLHRRGRYAEFNLAFDRGTRFGLQSGGRVESILASLPPCARWDYNYKPAEGSPEAALDDFLQPREWLQ
ncbi:MAG: oxygen-dependent coproporphyrinogen oxidase [Gammaproteobacteria bacterium]